VQEEPAKKRKKKKKKPKAAQEEMLEVGNDIEDDEQDNMNDIN